jgi:hypothetical protein
MWVEWMIRSIIHQIIKYSNYNCNGNNND